MASRKVGRSASNVMDFDDARKRRQQRQGLTTSPDPTANSDDACAADSQSCAQPADDSGGAPIADKPKIGNRSFDREKVDRIKARIARGEYKIDYFQVADKYIEHERFS
ncbi:MAG: flagellar biosynthesis anti-sigma factor FlgM [Granulosicoccus sp.]|nr:flagellar biosynthesis anti-sigma factor FlgM [Granulosicoccus sp.]